LNQYIKKYTKTLNCHIDKVIISETFQENIESFAKIFEIGTMLDEEYFIHNLSANQEYHYKAFIEYFIFQKYSNYYPYFRLGKRNFSTSIDYSKPKTVAKEIIDSLLYSYSSFTTYGDGIRKIITSKDLTFLSLDLDKIKANKTVNEKIISDFKHFIDYLKTNNLGLISGLNLDENRLISKNFTSVNLSLDNLIHKERSSDETLSNTPIKQTVSKTQKTTVKYQKVLEFNGTIDEKYLSDLMYAYQVASGQSFFTKNLKVLTNYLVKESINVVQNGQQYFINTNNELEKVLREIDNSFKINNYE